MASPPSFVLEDFPNSAFKDQTKEPECPENLMGPNLGAFFCETNYIHGLISVSRRKIDSTFSLEGLKTGIPGREVPTGVSYRRD